MKKRLRKKKCRGWDEMSIFVDAACSQNIGLMKKMIEKGYDVNQSGVEGETAFSWCCQRNSLSSAKFLFENGADVNATFGSVACGGFSKPLDVAVCWASPEFRGWLRSVGGTRLKDSEEWPWPRPLEKP